MVLTCAMQVVSSTNGSRLTRVAGLPQLGQRSRNQAAMDTADDCGVRAGQVEEGAVGQGDLGDPAPVGGLQLGGVAPLLEHVDHLGQLAEPPAGGVGGRRALLGGTCSTRPAPPGLRRGHRVAADALGQGRREQAAEQAQVVGLGAGVDVVERAGRQGVDLARPAGPALAAHRRLDEAGRDELVEVEAHGRDVQADLGAELGGGEARGVGVAVGEGERVDDLAADGRREQRCGVGLRVGRHVTPCEIGGIRSSPSKHTVTGGRQTLAGPPYPVDAEHDRGVRLRGS